MRQVLPAWQLSLCQNLPVTKALSTLFGQVAIKLLPRGEFIAGFKTYVQREIMHQGSLKHPFIVALKEVNSGRSERDPLSCQHIAAIH